MSLTTVDARDIYNDLEFYQSLLGKRYFNIYWVVDALYGPPETTSEEILKVEFSLEFEVYATSRTVELSPVKGLLSKGRFDNATLMDIGEIKAVSDPSLHQEKELLLAEIAKRTAKAKSNWDRVKNDYRPLRRIYNEWQDWIRFHEKMESVSGVVFIDVRPSR